MARWRIPIYCELARQLVERRTPERNSRPPEARLLPASESRRKLRQYFISLGFQQFKQRTMILNDVHDYMF